MKKGLLLLFITNCLGLSAKPNNALVIELKSDTAYHLMVDEAPNLSLRNGVVKIEGKIAAEIAMEEVSQLYFTEIQTSSIDHPTSTKIEILCNEETLQIKGLNGGEPIRLLDANGKLFSLQKANGNEITMKMPTSAGFYILQIGSQAFKITKK